MILHDYHRSSAAFRVRIALNLKNVAYTALAWDLDQHAQRTAPYLEVNPQGLVPALEDGAPPLFQSGAIIEYLDEKYNAAPLLPDDALGRARVRGIFQQLTCDIHPLTTRRVAWYLDEQFAATAHEVIQWRRAWVFEGLQALETSLAASPHTGRFCHGDTPTLADVGLVPQVVSAQTLQIDLEAMPTISRIHANCMQVGAFRDAHPDNCSSSPHLAPQADSTQQPGSPAV